jgi:hypothetical protein
MVTLQVEELITMENEHGKNLSVLFDCELKASTSQDLLCEQKHSEDESESFSDIDDEEVTNKSNVLSIKICFCFLS